MEVKLFTPFAVVSFLVGVSSQVFAAGAYELEVTNHAVLDYFYDNPAEPQYSLTSSGFIRQCSSRGDGGICPDYTQTFRFLSSSGARADGYIFWKAFGRALDLKTMNFKKDNNSLIQYVRSGNGQCVDLVKKFTSSTVRASNWIRGNKVSEYWDPNALKGKAIATFSCGGGTRYCASGYPVADHTAVILAAEGTGHGPISAVWVVEQNVAPVASVSNGGSISKRRIVVNPNAAHKSFNLDNYYIVTHD